MTLTPTQQEKITALKNAMDGYFVNESDIATSFSDNPSDAKVASEKLVKDSLDSMAGISDFYIDTETDEIVIEAGGSGSGSGSGSGGVDIVTEWEETLSDGKVPSEKLVKDSLDLKISTSQTQGLMKNDGSVMTSGTGATNYAVGNHTHSGYASLDYMAYIFKSAYNVNGTTTNFDISSIWTNNMVDTPLFAFIKNTIGDNVENATLKFKTNGSNITILDANNSMQPIQAEVWKKDTWALFFCVGNSVQLKGVFYDTITIESLINNMTSSIPTKTSDLQNDSGFLTEHQSIKTVDGNSLIGTGNIVINYNDLSNKPTIPTDVSDLTDTQNTQFTPKSHNHTKSQITDFPTIPSKVSDLQNDSGFITSSAISNMVTASDIVNDLNTTTSGKVLDARQGKVLNDLIGQAITYINK